jgi:hypothetical protein
MSSVKKTQIFLIVYRIIGMLKILVKYTKNQPNYLNLGFV